MHCDVVFISYDEPNADQNFERLLAFAPAAKRVHGVKGILNAHHHAARIAESEYFFVVDGDNWILDGFRFDPPDTHLSEKYLWSCRNAVNGMVWGNGGIKLLNRADLLDVDDDRLDFFVAMKGKIRVVKAIASETRFNATPFLAWRCGFRECAKLTGGMFMQFDVSKILHTWQNIGSDKLNGNWCILGSRQGASFGEANKQSASLGIINDMDWLRGEFLKCRETLVHGDI